jgi:hypothetical protein
VEQRRCLFLSCGNASNAASDLLFTRYHGSPLKFNFGTFDIESWKWVNFILLGFFDGTEFRYFDKVEKFLDHINHRKFKGWRFFAHNGGKFDFLFLCEEMLSRGWQINLVPRGSSVIIIKVQTPNTNFVLSDSYALLPDSLDKLATGFKVEHQKVPFNFKRKFDKNHPRMREHLRNDCYSLYEVLAAFFASEYVVTPKFTIASQALSTFTEKFLDCDLVKTNLPDEELIRKQFYSGGRVEVYKGEGTGIRCYDVNSLYPYAMLEEMPCGIPKTVTRYEPDRIGFYKVRLKSVPKFYISPLLTKIPKGTYLQNYYTNGEGVYYLSSKTLEYLKREFGVRFNVDFGIVFPRRKELFRDYVETFFKLKREAKGTGTYLIAKYMLNSLYGKFGQNRWKDSIQVRTPNMKVDYVSFDDYYGLVLVTRRSHNKFIMPYLAAYITECARLHHFQLMNRDPEKIFYCDTDSIFTTSDKYKSLVGEGIGQLSDLGSYSGVFLAPKAYALKDGTTEAVTFKGFDPTQFSFRDFRDALRKGTLLKMKDEKVMSFKQATAIEEKKEKMKLDPKTKPSKYKVIQDAGYYLKLISTTKVFTAHYDKRKLFRDKTHFFDSEPFNQKELTK